MTITVVAGLQEARAEVGGVSQKLTQVLSDTGTELRNNGSDCSVPQTHGPLSARGGSPSAFGTSSPDTVIPYL